ncbi:MAG: hypothetical protein LBL34_03320 [Clostridiales bacterium]|jgi:hypothetical protein|nr:hypothetical protein [Clostridiales bacterium]
MEYDFHTDMGKITKSPYEAALCWKGDPRDGGVLKLMGNKFSAIKRIAQMLGANEDFCEALLNTLDLATPPLGESGEKFLTQELGFTQRQVAIAIAEEIGLSAPIVSALKDDAPKTVEASIVDFVNETFSGMKNFSLNFLDAIEPDAQEKGNGKKARILPQLRTDLQQLSSENKTKKSSLDESKIFDLMREKLAKTGAKGMDAALQFVRLTDYAFAAALHTPLRSPNKSQDDNKLIDDFIEKMR